MFILDSLATYQAVDDKEAEKITERVAPRLQHANCAVVLSAVKVRARVMQAACACAGGLLGKGCTKTDACGAGAYMWAPAGR